MSNIIKSFLTQWQHITLSCSPRGDAPPSHTLPQTPDGQHHSPWGDAQANGTKQQVLYVQVVNAELFSCHCVRLEDILKVCECFQTVDLNLKSILGK